MYLYFVVSRRIICNNVQHGGTVTLHSTHPERTVRTSALVKEKEKMRTSHREIRIKAKQVTLLCCEAALLTNVSSGEVCKFPRITRNMFPLSTNCLI